MTLEATVPSQESTTIDPWYGRAKRWTQLTFVEDDPLHFDRDFWFDVMRRSQSNAACISAGGYVAYYPTKVDFHYKSKHLGDMDLFGMVNEDARRLGMDVMARIDPHAIHADAAAAHPEWVARDENGEPIEHWAFPGIWLTCPFSTYYSEFTVDITREIVKDYNVDAVFANRWEGSTAISYSEGAQRSFFDATGAQLPTGTDRTTSEWNTYFKWRSDHLSRQIVEWDKAVRDINPNGSFIPNRGGLLTRDLNAEVVKDMYPAFYVDKQGRSTTEAIWSAGRVGKRARGLFPDRPVTLITSVGPEIHAHRWKDSVAAAPEIESWIVDGFVHGALPWFTKFNAHVPDSRWVEPIVDAFGKHVVAEKLYGDKKPTARVAVLDTTLPDGSNPPWSAYFKEDHAEDGLYQALVEARIPFEFLVGDALSAERLAEFSVVVMANSSDLTQEHIELLRGFVAQGGRIVADEGAVLVNDRSTSNDLAELFGVRATGPIRRGVQNNYITITDPDHTVAMPFAPAERILGGTAIVPIELVADDAAVLFRFVPDFPDLPMEEVYPRESPRDAAVVLREHQGGGRTAYAAFNLSSIYWEALQDDHAVLLVQLVKWALDGDLPVKVAGEGLADVAVRESEAGVTVSIVNLDNPKAMRGQMRSFRPIGEQTVTVGVPDGVSHATVRTLSAPDETRDVEIIGGSVEIVIDRIELLEVVEFAWS